QPEALTDLVLGGTSTSSSWELPGGLSSSWCSTFPGGSTFPGRATRGCSAPALRLRPGSGRSGLPSGQQPQYGVEHYAVQGHEQHDADHYLGGVIDAGDFHPVGGHEFVAAAPEGHREEHEGIQQVAEDHRGAGCYPPVFQSAQAVEYLDVQQLAADVGHEA